MFKVEITDYGNVDRALREIKILKTASEVEVGLFNDHQVGSRENGDNKPIAEIGFDNEFGREGIPSRPFMRMTHDLYGDKMADEMAKNLSSMGAGLIYAKQILNKAGSKYESYIKQTILHGSFAPNSQRTLEKKKKMGHGGKPLLDYRVMLDSITYRIKE